MIYYANGCSFTWGGTLFNFYNKDGNFWLPDHPNHPLNKKRLETVYPHHLGKLINAEKVINHSLGAGSNYRIVRTTLEYFNNLILNDQPLDNHFVTIQWTEPSRYEFYDLTENSWALIMHSNAHYEKWVSGHGSYLTGIKDYYYKHIQSVQNDFVNFINHLYCLGNFFKAHNIPYLFFKHAGWDSPFIDHDFIINMDQYKKLLVQFNWYKNDPFLNMYHSPIEQCIDGSHPSELGHIQWAELLFEDIKNSKLL